MTGDNIFLEAQKRFVEIAKELGLKLNLIEELKNPNFLSKFQIPVLMDNGETKIFTAFRSQHNDVFGPYKGGIRFYEKVSEEEIKTLSMLMTWKCSLVGIPFGGGKGGVIVNPRDLSEKELEGLSRGYVRKIFPLIGPHKDVPAPDMNTNSQIMAWMVDEYSKLKGEPSPAAFTGKSLDMNGLKGRTEATGYGGVVILEKLKEVLNLKPEETTIAIQGFGNVGFHFAKIAFEKGYKIIALSEYGGGVYLEEGLDPEKVFECRNQKDKIAGCYCNGSVCDIKEGKIITNEELLEIEVDVLVPAAIENVIREDNAIKIKAKHIIAMANNPITKEAQKILEERGIVVVPDFLSNSGGVVASYFEWLQAIEGNVWEKQKTFDKLSEILGKAFDEVWSLSKEKKISLNKAAYLLAVSRVAKAVEKTR